ncbi:MAG TPA: DUF63 family protein [archaeon]|nr:DUF63 family protein [archaeon]
MVSLQDFLDYFIYPKKTGYDVPKTLTYALILVIAAYLIFKMLKKLKVKIDRRLVLAVSPYVLFGGSLRVVEDLGYMSSPIFVTPGIYFLIAFIFISVFLISLLIEKKRGIPYFKITFITGLLLFSFTLANISPTNLYGLFLVLVFLSPWAVVFFFFKRWNLANRITSLVQMFDATATFVALNFFGQNGIVDVGFYEQHVVPTFIINIFGPASFIIVKIIAVVLALFIIDRFSEDKEFGNYLKLIIGILGLATGTRDLLAIGVLL